jgi:hypothetical protein
MRVETPSIRALWRVCCRDVFSRAERTSATPKCGAGCSRRALPAASNNPPTTTGNMTTHRMEDGKNWGMGEGGASSSTSGSGKRGKRRNP